MKRLCLFCNWFNFFTGQSAWSEVTPGTDFRAYCGLGKWEFENQDDSNTGAFQVAMMIAQKCEDYDLDALAKEWGAPE